MVACRRSDNGSDMANRWYFNQQKEYEEAFCFCCFWTILLGAQRFRVVERVMDDLYLDSSKSYHQGNVWPNGRKSCRGCTSPLVSDGRGRRFDSGAGRTKVRCVRACVAERLIPPPTRVFVIWGWATGSVAVYNVPTRVGSVGHNVLSFFPMLLLYMRCLGAISVPCIWYTILLWAGMSMKCESYVCIRRVPLSVRMLVFTCCKHKSKRSK